MTAGLAMAYRKVQVGWKGGPNNLPVEGTGNDWTDLLPAHPLDTMTIDRKIDHSSARPVAGTLDLRVFDPLADLVPWNTASPYYTSAMPCTLGAAVASTSVTTITVVTPTPYWPDTDIVVTVDSEDMLLSPPAAGFPILTVGTAVLTVVRGYNGTTPATHLNGATVAYTTRGLELDRPIRVLDYWNLMPTADAASFEGGAGGWTALSNCTVLPNGPGRIGSNSLRLTGTGTTYSAISPAIDSRPGAMFSGHAWFKQLAGSVATHYRVKVRFYSAAGGGGSVLAATAGADAIGTAAFVEATVNALAPSGTLSMRLIVEADGLNTDQTGVDTTGLYPAPDVIDWSAPGPGTNGAIPRFYGFIDSIQPDWEDTAGLYSEIHATDALSVLQRATILGSPSKDATLATAPLAYWRMADTTADMLADTSGNNHPAKFYGVEYGGTSASPVDTPIGPTQMVAVGQDSALNIDDDHSMTLSLPDGTMGAATGWAADPQLPWATNSYTWALWFRGTLDLPLRADILSGVVVGGDGITLVQAGPTAGDYDFLDLGNGPELYLFARPTSGTDRGSLGPCDVFDNKWHRIVATYNTAGDVHRMWLDGALQGSTVIGPFTTPQNSIYIGFGLYYYNSVGAPVKTMSSAGFDETCFWNRVLSDAEIVADWNAGRGNWANQRSNQRIASMLDLSNWSAIARNLTPGVATLQPLDTNLANTQALDHINTVADTEQGIVFIAADGDVTAFDRQRSQRPPYTTPVNVFGENTGEIPYLLGRQFQAPLDKTDLYNSAAVQRQGGVRVAAEPQKQSAAQHNTVALADLTGILTRDDLESADLANLRTYKYATAQTRIRNITITPRSNPDLIFPALLAMELHDRQTVHRRQMAGTALTQDVLVESINETVTPGTWEATLGLTAAESPTFWVWGGSSWGSGAQPTRWGA